MTLPDIASALPWAGMAALGGVGLGSWLTYTFDSKKVHLEKRIQLYSSMYSLIGIAVPLVNNHDSDEMTAGIEKLLAFDELIHNPKSTYGLFSSPRVHSLSTFISKVLSHYIAHHKGMDDEAEEKIGIVHEEMVRAMRRDLRVSSGRHFRLNYQKRKEQKRARNWLYHHVNTCQNPRVIPGP